MDNEIKYCVNYKGQKIKPYKSTYVSPKKQIDWDKIISYALLISICTIPVLLVICLYITG